MKARWLLVLAAAILLVSIPLLVWGYWPMRRETVTVPLMIPAGMPSLSEGRTIRLTYSPVMRLGDSQTVNLDVTSDGKATNGNIYAEYNVIVEARLDLPFAGARPAETASTALVEGSGASFSWVVTPHEASGLRGTAWLYLRFVPKAGGEEARGPVSAQLVEIRTRSVLRRTGPEARAVGVIGSPAGLGILLWTRRVHRTFQAHKLR